MEIYIYIKCCIFYFRALPEPYGRLQEEPRPGTSLFKRFPLLLLLLLRVNSTCLDFNRLFNSFKFLFYLDHWVFFLNKYSRYFLKVECRPLHIRRIQILICCQQLQDFMCFVYPPSQQEC